MLRSVILSDRKLLGQASTEHIPMTVEATGAERGCAFDRYIGVRCDQGRLLSRLTVIATFPDMSFGLLTRDNAAMGMALPPLALWAELSEYNGRSESPRRPALAPVAPVALSGILSLFPCPSHACQNDPLVVADTLDESLTESAHGVRFPTKLRVASSGTRHVVAMLDLM